MNPSVNTDPQLLQQRVVDFVCDASMEITPHDEEYLSQVGSQLAPGSEVYIAHTPKSTLEDVVRIAGRVQEMGFQACAHIAARRLTGEAVLRSALERLKDAGCDRVLLVAGDSREPAGPYPGTLEILASGITADCGFKTIAVAGHPEGNRHLSTTKLWEALSAKQAFARESGTSVYVVTQFGFNAQAIIAWSRHLGEHGILLPVHVGLAGPAPLDKLIRYALLCGIGASLRAAVTNTSLIGNLTKAARSVDQVVAALVGGMTVADRARLAKPHFFPFGGCVATARWIRAVRNGDFAVNADGSGFAVRT